jgi:DNA polymerase III delta prime subunit
VPSILEVKEIIETLLNPKINFDNANIKINELIKTQGYSLSIVLKELVTYLINNKINNLEPNKLASYLSEMADLENRVTKSTFGDIYMSGLVGIFKS